MVSFYKPKKSVGRNRKNGTAGHHRQAKFQVTISRWDFQGQGVCSDRQPVMFVPGALPGETCDVAIVESRKQVEHGRIVKVCEPSAQRIEPFCPVAGECGGCQLQHVTPEHALTLRQQALDTYWRKAFNTNYIPWQAPVTGPTPAYRRITRLAVDGRDPNRFRLGFRKAQSKDVVNVAGCPVLQPELSALIAPLRDCLSTLANRQHIGHVGLMAGDNVAQVNVRFTRSPSQQARQVLLEFASQHKVNMCWQLGSEDWQSLHEEQPLQCHTEKDLSLRPEPNDFIQVNASVNQAMIEQAMAWLSPQPGEKIADWFSGLGNFSLSLAKRGAQVEAVEGIAEMVQRAEQNAQRLGIDSVIWRHLDLSDQTSVSQALAQPFDKVLLDPSREGAYTVCEALARQRLKKILYVSCNPSTFTRDAKLLLQEGYQLEKVGIIEMFPYTRHLEVMALFTGKPTKKAS